jgi:nucleotide-binding universal stress UspA family protein
MKRLLVALDGSPRARDVLMAAVAQAQSARAELVLLRVVGIPSDVPYTALAMTPAEVLGVLEQQARAEVTALARPLIPPDVAWDVRIETATAWQAICRTAQSIDADLIVIGSHGYGGLDRVLGTTAARVVNHADRSVLVARKRPSNSEEGTGKTDDAPKS